MLWQRAWLFYSVVYIVFMIVVEMSIESTMIGFVIPSQVLRDIRVFQADLSMRLATRKLQQNLLSYSDACSTGTHVNLDAIEKGNVCGDKGFSVTSQLFV